FNQQQYFNQRNTRVFNLCSSFGYQSKGYYVSLLAEARGHRPIPDVKNLQDSKSASIIRNLTDDLDNQLQRSLKNIRSNQFELSVYFGKNVSDQYSRIAKELHRLFPMPLFRAKFAKTDKWFVQTIRAIGLSEVPEHHIDFMRDAALEYFDKKRYNRAKESSAKFDLAILIKPEEEAPPSDKKALEKFKEIAEKNDFFVEFITKEDSARLNEFDALFIRTTTSVNHYTYRMARKAESAGLVVIDDPSSILKCANKVYLAELLRNAKIATPKTLIIHSDNRKEVVEALGLPCILKLPDSSFSLGVIKVSTQEELDEKLKEMLEHSDLVVGQEFRPTAFDWRIGVIEGKAFYACKYFMASGHWQIYNWGSEEKEDVMGEFETLPLEKVPEKVVKLAEEATWLIGKGLYGVDIKELDGEPVIIEINDNPSIDFGVEDLVAGDEVYRKIIESIRTRLHQRLGMK
ncbi:MAG: RimK family protein, partial [Flavobacteriales bacterium]